MSQYDSQPLADLSVVELSTMVAGPYAGQLLGDLGADVVKLERPEGGELARQLEPTVGGESFYYLTANRNKRSLAVDVTTDEGREAFFRLVESADVVLENFPPQFTEGYGIDYESTREHNEDIVYCSISAYGETGPYREDPGIDTTVQALSGAMSMTRDESTPPMRSGVPMNDVFAALHAVSSILAALRRRDRVDGAGGEHLDVSLLDAGITGLTTRATYSLYTDEPYPPFGRRHNYFAPEGVYEVDDGEVQLSVVTDRHWRRFCEVLDAPELAAAERFETVNDRVRNREALESELADRLDGWGAEELVAALREAGIPAGLINDTLSVWDHPQVEARELKRTLEHPEAGEIETLGFPVKYRNVEPSIDRHPPRLGEHTAGVLAEHGYSEEEIERLREAGVVDE
jgi:formyl-CoA transferase